MVDVETTIGKYRVGYRIHEPNPRRNPSYLDSELSSSSRQHQIGGLDEYALYDLRLNAIDANGLDLEPYLETRRTSAKRTGDFVCTYSRNVGILCFDFPRLVRTKCSKFDSNIASFS